MCKSETTKKKWFYCHDHLLRESALDLAKILCHAISNAHSKRTASVIVLFRFCLSFRISLVSFIRAMLNRPFHSHFHLCAKMCSIRVVVGLFYEAVRCIFFIKHCYIHRPRTVHNLWLFGAHICIARTAHKISFFSVSFCRSINCLLPLLPRLTSSPSLDRPPGCLHMSAYCIYDNYFSSTQ